jgi:CheY-like chemotaxis protein
VVVDIGMPVMDGLQLLRLLRHAHPGQQAAVLTGLSTPENRRASLDAGAVLFLEKPRRREDYQALYAALEALTNVAPQSGFRGMMRRVGLQEILQMECLGRKTSLLEVFTGSVRGHIYIFEGNIVHAESGNLQGEVGLYALLGLRAGEFNFMPYTEPATRTISTHYEFLLMEAARLTDETAAANEPEAASISVEAAGSTSDRAAEPGSEALLDPALPEVAEMLLCSGTEEVLYEYECEVARRIAQLQRVKEQAHRLSALFIAGMLDRFEVIAPGERLICQVQPRMRVLVRTESLFIS